MSGICLITCVFVKDRGLTRPEDHEHAATAAAAAKEAADGKDVERGMGGSATSLPHSHMEQEKAESLKEKDIEITKPAVAAVDPRL